MTSQDSIRRLAAAASLGFNGPAILFMAALLLRGVAPFSHGANDVVRWYAERIWTLWLLLLALPFAALAIGCLTLYEEAGDSVPGAFALSRVRVTPALALTAIATLASACILFVVVLHMAAN